MIGALLGGALSLYLGETYNSFQGLYWLFWILNLPGIAIAMLFELIELFMDIMDAIFDSHHIKNKVGSNL